MPPDPTPFAGTQAALVKPSNRTEAKINSGSSLQIPSHVNTTSPSGGFGSRPIAHAVIYALQSNDTGINENATFQPVRVDAGRTVAVAVAANVLTVTLDGAEIARVVGTALTAGAAYLYYA